MKRIKLVLLLASAVVLVSIAGCAKGPESESSTPAQSNKNAGQGGGADLSASPLYAKTARGDVERAGLAIQMARDYTKQEQWNEAVVQLRAAQTQIDEALGRKPPLKEQYEELRSALVRAIQSAENRNKEVEAQFNELQTRVNALKVYSGQ
jgi:CRISPR/Cas system CSM-associated protein Csm2 small subunit